LTAAILSPLFSFPAAGAKAENESVNNIPTKVIFPLVQNRRLNDESGGLVDLDWMGEEIFTKTNHQPVARLLALALEKKNAAQPELQNWRGGVEKSLHQQHLARALDGRGHAALVMRGQAGVFARQNAALVGHERAEQGHVFVIERVGREINLRLGPRRAVLAGAALVGLFVGVGLAWHIT
jgi:hypothetical protein